MRLKHKYIFLLVFCFTIQSIVFGNDGESLFIENCAICHTIGQSKLIGPDLKNIHTNRSFEYFKSFVKNSQSVINSGDSIAITVYQKFDETIMPEHSLSDEEITQIWSFIQSFKGNAFFEFSFPTAAKQNSKGWLIYFFGLMVLMIAAIVKRRWLVIQIVSLIKKIPFQRVTARNWKIIAVLFIFLIILIKLNNIGDYKGYQPKQPILFMHNIHCSQNEISCRYCHSEAYNGENGGIPPLLTCMNCHRYVKNGTLTDTVEIAKLYEWIGFDFKTKTYNKKPKQMAWIRVHNLPDHARFNHSVHTQSNITCTECHGEVEKMNEIRQVSTLTMKWCVDCHIKNQVALVGYYSENDSDIRGFQAMSAEDRSNFSLRTDTIYKSYKSMGGLDCYKCHN